MALSLDKSRQMQFTVGTSLQAPRDSVRHSWVWLE